MQLNYCFVLAITLDVKIYLYCTRKSRVFHLSAVLAEFDAQLGDESLAFGEVRARSGKLVREALEALLEARAQFVTLRQADRQPVTPLISCYD